MTDLAFTSTATNTVVSIAIPTGRLRRGRVKLVTGTDDHAQQVHPDKPHRWHDMLDHLLPTAFVQCRCGAVGVPYRRSR